LNSNDTWQSKGKEAFKLSLQGHGKNKRNKELQEVEPVPSIDGLMEQRATPIRPVVKASSENSE
jgi:hypothetical protein